MSAGDLTKTFQTWKGIELRLQVLDEHLAQICSQNNPYINQLFTFTHTHAHTDARTHKQNGAHSPTQSAAYIRNILGHAM